MQVTRMYVSMCLLGAFTVVPRTHLAAQGTPEQTVQVSPAVPQQTPKPVKVSSGVMAGLLLHKVAPVYPVLASRRRGAAR